MTKPIETQKWWGVFLVDPEKKYESLVYVEDMPLMGHLLPEVKGAMEVFIKEFKPKLPVRLIQFSRECVLEERND